MTTMNTELEDDTAFEQGFASINAEAPEQDKPAPAAAEPEKAPASQSADTSAAAQTDANQANAGQPGEPAEPVVDPFAAFPKEVRDILARVPQMEAELAQTRRVANMVPALQSRLDKLAQTAAAEPAPARRLERVQALRDQGLPEIADALEELAATMPQQGRDDDTGSSGVPQPAAPAAGADPQMEVLEQIRPTWGDDLNSTDFKLWLARQAPEYEHEVRSTTKATVILKALGNFDAFRQQITTNPAQQVAASRATRMAAAVTPQGEGRRAPSRQAAEDDEEAAMNTGFRAVTGRPLR